MPTKPTYEELAAQVAELEQQVDQLKAKAVKYRTLLNFIPQGTTGSDTRGNNPVGSNDESGSIAHPTSAQVAIAGRRLIEEHLKIYKNIVSSSTDGISFLDKNYRYIIINDAYEKFSGVDSNKLFGLTVSEYLGEDVFKQHIKPNFDRCLQGVTVNYAGWFEYPALGKRFVDITYYPYRVGDNEILGVIANTKDITERKSAEEKLLKSENKFIEVTDSIPGIVYQYTLHPDGSFSVPFVSSSILQFSGYTSEEVMSDPSLFFNRIHPDDRDFIQGEIQRSANNFEEFRVVHRLITPEGQTKWFSVRSIPHRLENGDIYWNGISINITEQKIAEQKLVEREEILNSLHYSAPVGMGLTDVESKFHWPNRRLSEITGYSLEELEGMPTRLLYATEEEYNRVSEDINKNLASTGYRSIETNWKRRDGTNVNIVLNTSWRRSKYPEQGLIFTALDITDRKEGETALKRQADTMNTIFNCVPNILAIVNENGRIEKINNRGVAFAGRSREQLIDLLGGEVFNCINSFDGKGCGRNPECIYCPVRSSVEKTMKTGENINDEEVQMTFFVDGIETTLDVLISTAMINMEDSKKVLLSISDITRLKQTERENVALASKIQQAQRMESIGNLAGGIAHDFNNILYPIIGMSEMLLEDLPEDSQQYENAEEILRAGKRGSDLVKQILAFSRQSEHKLIPVRVQQVLKEVIKLTRSTIPSYIEMNQDVQQDCGLVMADSTQIHQVAMNIITNAYHAVENEGGKIVIKLEETLLAADELLDSTLKPGLYVVLSISDTGPGMPPNLLTKIFEPYFTTKGNGKGTGLGLAVVYGIVKEHLGDIKVYSEVGKGTTFKVYLPTMERPAETVSTGKVEDIKTGNERILLVDDEAAIARLEKQMLERLGYQVTSRISSLDALEAFKANPDRFDLVITDMTMPNMTGDQLAKEINAIRPGIPIIVCTGFSERINPEKAAAMGIRGLLMKPIIRFEMAQMIREALDRRP